MRVAQSLRDREDGCESKDRLAYAIWEFWNEQYLGSATGGFRAVVPPRSARLYRLMADRPHPWVISTDMHVMQGQVELAEVRWDAETMTLSGKATRPAGEAGNLFILAPPGFAVADPRGLWIARDGNDHSLIIARRFAFGEQPEEWSVRFTAIGAPPG